MLQVSASGSPQTKPRWQIALSAILLILGSVQASAHGSFHIPGTVPPFWAGIAVMGAGYALSWRLDQKISILWFWGVAAIARLIFLVAYPGDDIWRYLWEGSIQLQGFSPYELAPNAPELLAYRSDWWAQINHPDVSAIYPPVTQLGFRTLAAIAPSVLLFKLAFTAADVAVCAMLWRRFGPQAILYAWNPLVIYSFAGGGHYDSWFVLPLAMAWLSPFAASKTAGLRKSDGEAEGPKTSRVLIRALFVGISISVKWISLPVLAFLSWQVLFGKPASTGRSRWQVAMLAGVVGLLPIALSALAYCDAVSCSLIPTSSTFVSHGRSAEFLPFIAKYVWASSLESNRWFAPPLALVTLVLLLRCQSLGRFILNYLIALMMLSPIVHAWYFTWMIPFVVGSVEGESDRPRNWGPIWGSLSVFVYFALLERQAIGVDTWFLEPAERSLLWLPFVAGCLWTYRGRGDPSSLAP